MGKLKNFFFVHRQIIDEKNKKIIKLNKSWERDKIIKKLKTKKNLKFKKKKKFNKQKNRKMNFMKFK